MDKKAYKPVNPSVHPSKLAMTCDTALFCVSYWGELMSACAVKEAVNARRKLLFVDLSMTHPSFKKNADVIAKRFGWNGIVFKYFNEHLTADNRAVNMKEYLANMLSGRMAVKDALYGSGWAVSNSGDTHIFFAVMHPYVLNILSILNRCLRVYYPHGIDQPSPRHLHYTLFLLSPRSLTTLVKTISRQKRATWMGIQLTIMGLMRGQWMNYPLPFTGIDYGYTISPTPIPAPYLRISPNRLQDNLRRIGTTDELFDQINKAEVNQGSSCIVLVQETGQSNQGIVNDNACAAYVHLIKSIKKKFGYISYWVKPHPRNSSEYYMTFLHSLRHELPEIQLVAMTDDWCRLPVEILAARGCWDAVASLGSCSIPPWAKIGIPHYASIEAARIYDGGFLKKKSYEDLIRELSKVGIVSILEDI